MASTDAGAPPLVGDVDDIDAGYFLEKFGGQMRDAAGAG
jgi:hypothetical protein